MSFIKHSEGKIISVVEDEELTEEQKKTAERLQDKLNDEMTSDKIEKTSGENLC